MSSNPDQRPVANARLDMEWARLIIFAKELGFTRQEISEFLFPKRDSQFSGQSSL